MGKRNLASIGLLILMIFTGEGFSDHTCEDGWEPYKDERCVQAFGTAKLVSYEKAENFCKEKHDANLVTIGFSDKQEFMVNFLKSKKIIDHVWIGLKYDVNNNNYVWSDNGDFSYCNWGSSSPKNDSAYCVQVETEEEATFGQWIDVPCAKKNLILCEKVQQWSLSQLQNEFVNLKKNLIPVGFIYAQLPGEKTPAEIWPWMTWQEISSNYAGIFFRVVGGNAAYFGTVQTEDSPRLVHVHREDTADNVAKYDTDVYADGKPSGSIDADVSIRADRALQFTVSAAEVRPRNTAMRVWKRTG